MSKPDFMMQTYIRCTRDALWDALTDPEQIAAFHFLANSITRDGDTYTYRRPDGSEMLVMRTSKEEPKTRIESSFEPKWAPDFPASRSVYRLEEEPGHMKLVIEHYDLGGPVAADEGVADGWARFASGLKTYLESGETKRFNTQGGMA